MTFKEFMTMQQIKGKINKSRTTKVMYNFDINTLPYLDFSSNLNISKDLANIDPDNNIPIQSNFQYCTTRDFLNNQKIRNCTSAKYFSVLYSNIRSLAANFENLAQILNELDHSFSVIGLTETKLKVDKEQVCNCTLPGYKFISQPSLSNAVVQASLLVRKYLTQ